jgi:ABC-type polysaccharide/polyol phosphate export permease
MFDKFYDGLADVKAMLGSLSIALTLGWQDIRLRYRRSKIGPFWITISTGVMVAMIGIIFGQALSMPMQEYLPFLSTGLILWTFISSAINEGSSAFIEASGMIRQLSIPMSTYTVRVLVRNTVILAHNIVILPVVLLVVGKSLTWNIFYLIPGFFIVLVNVFWISLVSGILCTRFRDMPSIVGNIIQVFFYLTPIIWIPSALTPRTANLIVEPNPFYHLLEIVRGPVLGYCPSGLSWLITVGAAVCGLILSFAFFGKFKDRIAYWV